MSESTVTEQPQVSGAEAFNSPTSGDSKNATAGINIKDPANVNDRSSQSYVSRQSRMQKIMAKLNDEDDVEVVEKKREQLDKESGVTKEPEASADSPDKEEKRREARRKEVEAKETKAEGDEPEKAEAKPEEKSETKAEADAKAEERPEEKAEEKEAAAKAEKERKARFEKVLALEAKNRKAEEKLKQREELVVRERQELEVTRRNLESQYQKLVNDHQRNVDMANQVLKLAKDNPLELLERAGVGPEIVGKWIQDSMTDPNVRMRKDMDRRFAELERREAEQRQAEAQRQREAEMSQTRQRVESEYLGHFEEKDEAGEYLLEPARMVYSRDEILKLGHQIADEASKQGYSFTSRDIAEAVSELAKDDDRYKTFLKRLSSASVTKPSTANAEEKVAPAPAKPAAATTTSTEPKATTTTVLNNRTVQDAVVREPLKNNPNYKRDRQTRLRRLQTGIE